VDLYANCFVRRDKGSHSSSNAAPAEAPPPGLRFSDMKRQDREGR